jgi:pimeloyl-ACP methyl ester carboxylesterase
MAKPSRRALSRREWMAALAAGVGHGACAARGTRIAPFAGARSVWSGFARFDFECEGRPAIVVAPDRAARGRPWLWRGEFFGAFANTDEALLARGWHVAYLDCRNTFGSPDTLQRWAGFHARLTAAHGLSQRAVLLGMSRGGLYVYRWAAVHPETVALIYGDAPVCDVKSWPGGKGHGQGSPKEWERFLQVFGLSEEEAMSWRGNPIDLLEPIAKARIPILHVVGDADDVVPPDENTAVLKQRYEALGGLMQVIVKKGVGHHPHGLTDPTPILEFIHAHAR